MKKLELEHLVEECCKDHDRIVTSLMNHCGDYLPEVEGVDTNLLVEVCLGQAFTRTANLEATGRELGLDSFMGRFLSSIYDGNEFFEALWQFAWTIPDKRAVLSPESLDGDFEAQWILSRFREAMKEGYEVSDALSMFADEIGDQFKKGNDKLLHALEEAARHPYLPSATSWILKAWLPLALWQKVEPKVKIRRLHDAWLVAKHDNLNVPDWPEPSEKNIDPVGAQIRAAKQRLARVGRRP